MEKTKGMKHGCQAAWLLAVALAAQLGAQQRQIPWGPNPGPVREPHFVPAARADFLNDSDQILGLSTERSAKAYPVPVVARGHFVQDQLDGQPVLATW